MTHGASWRASRRPSRRWLAALVGLLSCLGLSAAALAETPDTPRPPADQPAPGADQIRDYTASERYLDAQAFRDAFEGKTLHLSSSAGHYGSEYYMPGDRSLWIARNGPCEHGVWTYENSMFCFRYGERGPYCWSIYEQAGVYYARSDDGLLLEIYAVEEIPLQCDPELLS